MDKDYELPQVAGRKLEISNQEFENRCRFYICLELEKIYPDNDLIGVLSDAVRLTREHSDYINLKQR